MPWDDPLWNMLDAIHLANFFDDHGIPPIVFPLSVIAAAVLAYLLLLQPPPAAFCGDGECGGNETYATCPDDCTGTSQAAYKKAVVEILGEVKNEIVVTLKDGNGTFIRSEQGLLSRLEITGLRSNSVVAYVYNPKNGKRADSGNVPIASAETSVLVLLPQGFFDPLQGALKKNGTITVSVKDASTNLFMTAEVGIFISNSGSGIPVIIKNVTGSESFTLDADAFYQLVAKAPGYSEYVRAPEKLMEGQQIDAVLAMRKIGSFAGTANISICAADETGNMLTGGYIVVYDLMGENISSEALGENGCAEFALDANMTITAALVGAGGGCVETHSSQILLSPGNQSVSLSVTCEPEKVGHVRIRVLGENSTVLTNMSVITLWYSDNMQIYGTGPSHVLAAADGGYTEIVGVRALLPFYFIVSNLSSYPLYTSANYTALAEENKTIEVVLAPYVQLPVYNDTITPANQTQANQTPANQTPANVTPGSVDPDDAVCVGIAGDLNGNSVVDSGDPELLDAILLDIADDGYSRAALDNLNCADVNGDGDVTQEDYLCLLALLDLADVSGRNLYCGSCMSYMQSLGRYGLEICHDGLDNDCDSQVDEDCLCNSTQICDRRYDIDGIPDTNDFMLCRSLGQTDFSTLTTTWGAYQWYNEVYLNTTRECSRMGSSGWGLTSRCSDYWVSCLLHFPEGFSIRDDKGMSGSQYFGAVGEQANTGPLGALANCGGCPSCPDSWKKIGGRGGSPCNCHWDNDPDPWSSGSGGTGPAAGANCVNGADVALYGSVQPCECSGGQKTCIERNDTGECSKEATCVCSETCVTYCRYIFDPCSLYGGGVNICGPSISGGTEACTTKTDCMGVLSYFPGQPA